MTALLKITYKAGALLMAACAGLIVCSSCTDEEFMKGSGKTDKLSFGVSISDKWNAGPTTRSTENNGPKYEAYKFDNSDMWIIASEEEGIENPAFSETQMQTRGIPVESAVKLASVHKGFGVYAYAWKDEENETDAQLYINKEKIEALNSEEETGIWTAQSQHFWPTVGYRLKFYAFAPYDMVTLTSTKDNGLNLTHDVPSFSNQQKDLLWALPQGGQSGIYKAEEHAKVQLDFRHILTAVKIRAGKDVTGKITKVSISGVYGKGTLKASDINLTSTDRNDKEEDKVGIGENKWNLDKKSKRTDENPFSTFNDWEGIDLDNTVKGSDGTAMVVDNEATFMMLPQELEASATLEITFANGTKLSGSIGGDKKQWKMGHTYVYTISTTSILPPVFEVTPGVSTIAAAGGPFNYIVKSYEIETKGGTTTYKPIKWKLVKDESELFEEWSWWEGNTDFSGEGCDNKDKAEKGETKKLSVKNNPASKHLKDSELNVPGDDNANEGNFMDLSKPLPQQQNSKQESEGKTWQTRTTANCYMTFKRDHHYFPLVYGNAILNGRTNQNAYQGFKNHAGQNITSPFIEENKGEDGKNISIDGIELIWSDIYGGVESLSTVEKDITIDGKSKKVKFGHFRLVTENVSDGVMQGNIVLGAKAGGKIVWSWHIWVTNYRLDGPNNTIQAKGFDFMKYALGWCGATYSSVPRTAKLVFVQENTGEKRTITITQQADGSADVYTGFAPVYQWGRKDPMPGIDKIWYGTQGKNETTLIISRNQSSVEQAIQNPKTFYASGTAPWYNSYLYDYKLWNVRQSNYDPNASTNTGVKTVYDPSPRGFMVPHPVALDQGGNKNHVPGSGIQTGWYSDYNPNLKFYFAPWRRAADGQFEVPANAVYHGWYWTSTLNKSLYPWVYYMGEPIATQQNQPVSNGFLIRPIKEP